MPPATTRRFEGAAGSAAACDTATDRPATVTVAERGTSWFGATVSTTLPLPVRVPAAIAIHGGAPATVHAHPAPVVTATLLVPPPDASDTVAGLML
jgi:hypothetical protein